MPAPLVFRLRHLPTNAVVARVTRLDGFWRKGRGVLGLRSLSPGQGVWLPQVASVHTLFVTFPLDLLFLGKDFGTLAARRGVPPGQLWAGAWGAYHTLELGAGSLARLPRAVEVGDFWELYAE